jgi:hypothetical protein
MKPAESRAPADDSAPPVVEVPSYRPIERFWPYLELSEQPTDEELANLDPSLSEALFGTPRRPFSVSLQFPPFEGADYGRAVELARASAEYLEIGSGATLATARASIRRTRYGCARSSRSSDASTRAKCSSTTGRCRMRESSGCR